METNGNVQLQKFHTQYVRTYVYKRFKRNNFTHTMLIAAGKSLKKLV